MLIVCPSCATSYDVQLASLPPQGRQVRCQRCRTVWHAEPSHADKLRAAAAAIAPEHIFAAAAQAAAAAEPVAEPVAAPLAEATSEAALAAHAANETVEAKPLAKSEASAAADEHDSASAAVNDQVRDDTGEEPAAVEAPPIVPVDLDQGRPPIDIEADDFAAHRAERQPEDIESVAARRDRRNAKRRTSHWPLSRLQSGILALVMVDAILVGWRGDIVRALPQTASFYALLGLPVNLRGLVFNGVTTATEEHEGIPILVVEGNVVNNAGKVAEVPRLKFVLRNAARQEIYSWTAVLSRAVLPPRESVSFRTRLASPPPDGHDLVLRFVNRSDIIAGAR